MFKTFKEFLKRVFEAEDVTQTVEQPAPSAAKSAKTWKPSSKIEIPLVLRATDEQVAYAKIRQNSFGQRQKEEMENNELLKKNSLNGLIAEVVIADALGIERDDADTAEEHYSDGGVDIMINGIPCDVKCKTLRYGKDGLPQIYSSTEIKIVKSKFNKHLKNSLYIVGALYDENTRDVYVVGALRTERFMSRNLPGGRRKMIEGTSKEAIYKEIGSFPKPYPTTINELKRQVRWDEYFTHYGYKWDNEKQEAVKSEETSTLSYNKNKNYKPYYKGKNNYYKFKKNNAATANNSSEL